MPSAPPPSVPELATTEIRGLELLRPGTWNKRVYTAAELQGMADAFQETRGLYTPKAKLGHAKGQMLLQRDGLPSAGDVTNLYLRGTTLCADVANVPQKVASLIAAGGYGPRSCEIWFNHDGGNGKQYAAMLKGFAWLGEDAPAVSGLDDLIAMYTDEAGHEVTVVHLSRTADEILADIEQARLARKYLRERGYGRREIKRLGATELAELAASVRQKQNAWDGPAQVAAASVSDLRAMCAIVRGDGQTKGDYRLPHHDAGPGHPVNRAGVIAAAGALSGARGGLKGISPDQLTKAKAHIAGHYLALALGDPPWKKDTATMANTANMAEDTSETTDTEPQPQTTTPDGATNASLSDTASLADLATEFDAFASRLSEATKGQTGAPEIRALVKMARAKLKTIGGIFVGGGYATDSGAPSQNNLPNTAQGAGIFGQGGYAVSGNPGKPKRQGSTGTWPGYDTNGNTNTSSGPEGEKLAGATAPFPSNGQRPGSPPPAFPPGAKTKRPKKGTKNSMRDEMSETQTTDAATGVSVETAGLSKKQLRKALGLPKKTGANLSRKDLASLLGLDSDADVKRAIIELKAQSVSLGDFERQARYIEELKAEKADRHADELVELALSAGKLAPKQKAWAKALCLRDESAFAEYVTSAPKVVEYEELGSSQPTGTPVALTPSMLKVAKDLGISQEAFNQPKSFEERVQEAQDKASHIWEPGKTVRSEQMPASPYVRM